MYKIESATQKFLVWDPNTVSEAIERRNMHKAYADEFSDLASWTNNVKEFKPKEGRFGELSDEQIIASNWYFDVASHDGEKLTQMCIREIRESKDKF